MGYFIRSLQDDAVTVSVEDFPRQIFDETIVLCLGKAVVVCGQITRIGCDY